VSARRVVLLGASNLTLGFPHVAGRLVAGWSEPLHVFAAHGHGRSYGTWSRVLVRSLPGIVQCGLWNDLRQTRATESPISALVTDVGNDLLYGASPGTIVNWVSQCLDRLADERAEIVVTLLPLASVLRLSAWRYHLTRICFFPGRGPAWGEMRERAHELNDRLRTLAEAHGAHVVEPPLDWYGFDPIHVHRGRRREAWQRILSGWPSFQGANAASGLSWSQSLRLLGAPPAERRWLGWARRAGQPAFRLGSATVSLY